MSGYVERPDEQLASLMHISEEVCWLQQEQDLSAHNGDDRSTADLCSQKTILMIQLGAAELNRLPFFDTLCGYCVVAAS